MLVMKNKRRGRRTRSREKENPPSVDFGSGLQYNSISIDCIASYCRYGCRCLRVTEVFQVMLAISRATGVGSVEERIKAHVFIDSFFTINCRNLCPAPILSLRLLVCSFCDSCFCFSLPQNADYPLSQSINQSLRVFSSRKIKHYPTS